MANLYYIDDNGQANYIPVRAGVDSVNGMTGVVEIPIASNTQAGLVKAYPEWGGFGIKINPNGYLYVSSADNNAIDAKSDLYKPLVPAAIDRVVRAGLTSNSQITDADKPLICETIGADRPLRKIRMVRVDTEGVTNIGIDADENGNPFEAREIIIYGYIANTGSGNLVSFAINTTTTDSTNARNMIKITPNNSSIKVEIVKDTYWHATALVSNGGENVSQAPGNAYVSNRGASGVRNSEWDTVSSVAISCDKPFAIGTNFDIYAR